MIKSLAALSMLFVSFTCLADDKTELAAADIILNSLHDAASKADWDRYFALYTDDGIFLGTDVNERWAKDQFKGYAIGSKGWVYTMRERHMAITPDKNTIWFDEVLDSASYGTSQGSGLLVKTDSGWRIAQYHLVFPIPNDLADGFTAKIMEFERK
jgi:hypothetical protein